MKQKKQFLQWSMTILFCMSQLTWGQAVPTVTGNETYTIGLSTSLTTPANIRSAAHYQVTNSGTNYLNHAIQTALNAGYTKIYIEEGIYFVTAPINFYKSNLGVNSKPLLSGITIEGAGKGTIIKPFSSAVGHIFNLGVFQLPAPERLTNSFCENNIIQNLFLDLGYNPNVVGSGIKTGIRIGGRGQYNTVENIWIQNAAVASTENYRTTIVTGETVVNDIVEKSTQEINATVTTGAGAIYVDLPIDIPFVPNVLILNPSGLAYEADFNKFNNIHIRNCNIGISFNFMKDETAVPNIASVFNGNSFNNINIDWFKTAVDFGPVAATCSHNNFSNFSIQPDKTNNQFVFRRIHGDRNVLTNINTFDWAAALPCIFMYEISGASRELTIENSNLRATANLIDNLFYIKDSGTGTKLINNNDVNGYTNNILRGVKDFAVFGQNYYNQAENDFMVQDFKNIIFGGGSLQSSSMSYRPHVSGLWNHQASGYPGVGDYYVQPILNPAPVVSVPTPLCVITNRDHNGTFQWTKISDVLSASLWSHIAARNINMNGLAITNADNTATTATNPTNTAPGIRLDNNGNVRVGTQAPATINTPKLQVDGNVYTQSLIATNGSVPNNSTAVTFATVAERNAKSLVINAGSLLDNQDPLDPTTRSFKFFDFPKSNLDAIPWFWFALEDRNNSNRFRVVVQNGGFGELILSDKTQSPYFTVREDGNNNVTLTMPKDNSSVGIGTTVFSYPSDVTVSNDGIYKLAVNGKIRGTGLKLTTSFWSDFVFDRDYKLPTLQEVEQHIIEKGHLPNIPSEKEVVEKGLDVLEMAKLQMQKIEELTLYIIEQNKKIETLEAQVNQLIKK